MTAIRSNKTATDRHWNDRAQTHVDKRQVNIDDLVQRQLENDFVFAHLAENDRVLEVGCGNGFLTQEIRKRVAYVDSFDFAENMIVSALETYGEINNRFFVDSVLRPRNIKSSYDRVICIRVLINLQNVEEQKVAIRNMANCLRPGGSLILVEGYLDGFDALNELRRQTGLPNMKPAAINFYSHMAELQSEIEQHFAVSATWHSGMFDVLTRVAYPLIVGPQNALGPSEFHDRILPLARALNPEEFRSFARLRGGVLTKR